MAKPLDLLDTAEKHLHQTTQGYLDYARTGKGSEWKAAGKALATLRKQLTAPKLPNLGAVYKSGPSMLDYDLTHLTDGVDEHGSTWPAFDVGYTGLVILAPEPILITGWGNAKRRDGDPDGQSINIGVGESKIEYWVGHVEQIAPVGSTVARGAKLCVVSPKHEAPHAHFGLNARPLLGHDFAWSGKPYQHGGPTLRRQLTKALA